MMGGACGCGLCPWSSSRKVGAYEIMEEPDQCVPSLDQQLNPNHWQEQDIVIRIFSVQRCSHEWKAMETKIRRSLPSVNIDRIDRNQNTWIWEGYKISKRRVCKKNNGIVNEAELFYGNPHHDPITIIMHK